MKNLINKKILYIVCGGISAYKSLETIRLFKKNGAEIKTILTNSERDRLVCIFDDRNKVVEMWRRLGITCLQVDDGDF